MLSINGENSGEPFSPGIEEVYRGDSEIETLMGDSSAPYEIFLVASW